MTEMERLKEENRLLKGLACGVIVDGQGMIKAFGDYITKLGNEMETERMAIAKGERGTYSHDYLAECEKFRLAVVDFTVHAAELGNLLTDLGVEF